MPAMPMLPAELAQSGNDLVDMVINGECSFAFVINWAERALVGDQQVAYIDYVRSF